jgi:hypothetical protein
MDMSLSRQAIASAPIAVDLANMAKDTVSDSVRSVRTNNRMSAYILAMFSSFCFPNKLT